MKTAFIFPGQGSQKVGMLKDLAEADPDVDPNNPGLAFARKIAEENGLR